METNSPALILREEKPGDMGWVVYRHGAMIAPEFGWDNRFEALVAEIAAKFIREKKPGRDRCWIAERDGTILGSVFVVEETPDTAKLRLLYVEPEARGLGVGTALVAEAVAFARNAGYRRITLWTMSILHSARRIYEAAGFQLVHEELNSEFGENLTAQVWEREL